ncbi:hypothetical protein BSKO_05511 [Bryopsis sp. KO-2023]|nr:hypothetical protein BSKO_05511 [Bryopsis sp. KO-2023]
MSYWRLGRSEYDRAEVEAAFDLDEFALDVEGVFYGMFPGQMNKLHQSTPVWVVTRAKDWKAANSKEYLTKMDTETVLEFQINNET